LTVAALCVSGNHAHAQGEYPSRPIRLIIPVAPGGTVDILARLVSAKMIESMRQQVVVDNRASASGINAAELTARATPDGYTLFLPYHQHTVNGALHSKLPYHPVNDFTPITQLTRAGLMLVVNPSSAPRNLREFVEWARARSGALNFGSAGLGSGGHLAGELYSQLSGVKAQHIPYKGSGPAMIDLLAGQYHYGFVGLQGALTHVRAGKLRGLAVTTPKRVAALPDLPTVAEALPGFEVVGWFGIAAPAKLPAPILQRLHAEIVGALNQSDVRERILADGSEPVGNTPEEFRRYMLADMIKWGKVIRESGIRAE